MINKMQDKKFSYYSTLLYYDVWSLYVGVYDTYSYGPRKICELGGMILNISPSCEKWFEQKIRVDIV